jgi:Fic-DOC domain mobile mystery protein B
MNDIFTADDAATPLTDDEKADLIPSFITFRNELNAMEQSNILEAEQWAFGKKQREILDEKFLRELHKRMFGKVWKWAGSFRKTARNIGVDAWKISVELRTLLDDTRFWIEHKTYPAEEIAARFHHRLVWIHPFPNGNGRHARLAADLLLRQMGQPRFTWGGTGLVSPGDTRKAYVAALRQADQGDISALLAFVRT